MFLLHTDLIGKICKPTLFGLELEKEYENLIGFGNSNKYARLYDYCTCGGKYELSLMFINERPFVKYNTVWYCLKEIGVSCNGDWHWLTLNQLVVCEEKNID